MEPPADRSKSPNILSGEKAGLPKDIAEPHSGRSGSSSVASPTGDRRESDARSPVSISEGAQSGETGIIEAAVDVESGSPSVVDRVAEQEEPIDLSRSSGLAGIKPDEKDIFLEISGKFRTSSIVSGTSESKEPVDRSKSPSITDEGPDLKDTAEQIASGKSRSASITSTTSDVKGDRSRSSPSIDDGEKPDERGGITEPAVDRGRSASVASITSERKESTDRSKSPSVTDERSDLTDITERSEKASSATEEKPIVEREKIPFASTDSKREPIDGSVTSEKSDDKKSIGDSKSSSIAGDQTSDLTDVTERSMDKSPSTTDVTCDQRKPTEKAKSPVIPDKREEPEKSESPTSEKSHEEAKSARVGSIIEPPSAASAADVADSKDEVSPAIDKSRSSSVTSTTGQKEPTEKPASPTVAHDAEEPPGTASEKPDGKRSVDGSRAASVTDVEKPDLGDVTEASSDKSRSSTVTIGLTIEKSSASAAAVETEPPGDRSEAFGAARPTIDERVISEERGDVIIDKSHPGLIDLTVSREKAVSSAIAGKLDVKSNSDISQPRSPSIVLDEPINIDGSKPPSMMISEPDGFAADEKSSSDKAESMISSSAVSKFEPSSKADGKSGWSRVVGAELDDRLDAKSSSPEAAFRSLDIEKVPRDESAGSSRAGSPPIPDESSLSRSVLGKEERKPRSPVTSPEAIQKEMQRIREKRFTDLDDESHVAREPSEAEKSYDTEDTEGMVKVTAERRAEIERYILEEFIAKKRKISAVIIERIVMTYSVPQFVVMEIIEDIISRENVPRSAVFDFVDEESAKGVESRAVTPERRADIERHVSEEFLAKGKRITPELLEEMAIIRGVPRHVLVTIIEGMIVRERMPRNAVIDPEREESTEKGSECGGSEGTVATSSIGLERAGVARESVVREEPSDSTKGERSPDPGEVSPADSGDRHDPRALSASPSFSPIPSDKSTHSGHSPARSEPRMDDDPIPISEEKRTEVAKLLEEEYVKKGRKITRAILEEIIMRTCLPRYVVLEIVEEIILRRKIPRETVIDVEICQEEKEEEEAYDKPAYDHRYDETTESSVEYRMEMYPGSDEQRLMDKSVTGYPDYESQFRKAFVGGMTEMRTTHITTLSGKSTPDLAAHDAEFRLGAAECKPSGEPEPERPLATTHITTTDAEEDLDGTLEPGMRIGFTILRESKIAESAAIDEADKLREIKHDGSPASAESKETTTRVTGSRSVSDGTDTPRQVQASGENVGVLAGPGGIVERETESREESDMADAVKRSSGVKRDEPEAITRIIKRQIVEPDDEPEVVTKVVKREIIEQDEPEIVTKLIRREVMLPPDERTMRDKDDSSGEYVKTITTKTTRTIVTEELPDAELSRIDPSKIYTDPTSGATYRVVSEDGDADDATSGADVKRIVTTVTTITGPDGRVTTKKDVKESSTADIADSEQLLEKLIDSEGHSRVVTGSQETAAKSAERIVKETITSVTSIAPDVKGPFGDSGRSTTTDDSKREERSEEGTTPMEQRSSADRFESAQMSPLVRDLMSDDKSSYSGKSSPDTSLPKDIAFSGGSTGGKSTPEIPPVSPLIRDGAVIQPHVVSGRSTPDRRSDGHRSSTSTPEGFRSSEVIRTIITTTKTISDEGEIVTHTREVTETTNEKGETVVLAEKTDVKVMDERLPSKDAALEDTAISGTVIIPPSSDRAAQRDDSPGSDDDDGGGGRTSEKDRDLTSGSPTCTLTHVWASSSEERHTTCSDDEPPGSPLSQIGGYSPQASRRYADKGEEGEEEKEKQIEFSTAAMSGSFYGELPAVPPQISAMKTFHGETGMQKSSEPMPIHGRFVIEKEFAGGHGGERSDAKKKRPYVDEADLDFDKALMEHKEMKEASGAFGSGISPRYTNGSLRRETDDDARDRPSSSVRDDSKDDSRGDDSKRDPLEGWGTPLELPSPKPPRKFNLKNPAESSCPSDTLTADTFDVMKDWGEPLGLPSPAPVTNEISNKGAPSTPKKERKQTKKNIQSENIKNKKRSESPGKNEKKIKDSRNKVQPVYMDLAYVPHHGNSYYTSLEFFKRVRARYYVFSGTEPSREVYDALLEAKKTWEDKDLGEYIDRGNRHSQMFATS